MKPTSEDIKRAMHKESKVEFEGVVYDCISAYTYRTRRIRTKRIIPARYEVELFSLRSNSVMIVPADEIKILE